MKTLWAYASTYSRILSLTLILFLCLVIFFLSALQLFGGFIRVIFLSPDHRSSLFFLSSWKSAVPHQLDLDQRSHSAASSCTSLLFSTSTLTITVVAQLDDLAETSPNKKKN